MKINKILQSGDVFNEPTSFQDISAFSMEQHLVNIKLSINEEVSSTSASCRNRCICIRSIKFILVEQFSVPLSSKIVLPPRPAEIQVAYQKN